MRTYVIDIIVMVGLLRMVFVDMCHNLIVVRRVPMVIEVLIDKVFY